MFMAALAAIISGYGVMDVIMHESQQGDDLRVSDHDGSPRRPSAECSPMRHRWRRGEGRWGPLGSHPHVGCPPIARLRCR